jgi:hypothetical protein
MNNYSWMYRDLPQGLYWEVYCKWVKSFINFELLSLKNISEGGNKCPCVKCKNKNFHQ